jgi:hypothetical protein
MDRNDSLDSRLESVFKRRRKKSIKHQSNLKMKILVPGTKAMKAEKLKERNGVATRTGVRGSVEWVSVGL